MHADIDRFLGVLGGAVPMQEYFTLQNLSKIIGLRGAAGMMLGKVPPARSQVAQPAHLVQG